MALVYNLTNPLTVGDLNSSTTVSSLKLQSIALNYEDVWTKQGIAVLHIGLRDVNSGYVYNIVYQDPSALMIAQIIDGQIGTEIFQKLINDGKLPAGQLVASQSPAASTNIPTAIGSGSTTPTTNG